MARTPPKVRDSVGVVPEGPVPRNATVKQVLESTGCFFSSPGRTVTRVTVNLFQPTINAAPGATVNIIQEATPEPPTKKHVLRKHLGSRALVRVTRT